MYAAWTLNQTSCKSSYPQTPYLLVTGRKPFSPQFYFGQTGLFQTRRKDSPEMRAEWGIFLGYGDGAGSLRAYIPTRRSVYSRRYFQPMPSPPAEWSLVKRIRAPDRTSKAAELGTNPIIRYDLPLFAPPDVPQASPGPHQDPA